MKHQNKLLVIIICIFIQYCTNKIGRWHYEKRKNTGLFDVCHSILPYINNSHLPNILPLCLFPLICKNEQFWGKYLFIHLLRSICLISTVLPKCHPEQQSSDGIKGIMNGQYDKIFSGHMSYIWIATRILQLKSPHFISLNIIQALMILVSRMHYSVDIAVAIIVSELVYRTSLCIN